MNVLTSRFGHVTSSFLRRCTPHRKQEISPWHTRLFCGAFVHDDVDMQEKISVWKDLEANKIWPGLEAWRQSSGDKKRLWGENGVPVESENCPEDVEAMSTSYNSLAEYGRAVLCESRPLMKAALTHKAWQEYLDGRLCVGKAHPPPEPQRPETPHLVPAREIPNVKQSGLPPGVYTLHNLAHVELNAIDLAWDTVVRFSDMELPETFYADFARVADDESRHLGWCLQRIQELGYDYGCMPAHNLLWEGCLASSGDVGKRLAVVPMSQEARGLDAGGRLAERLVGWGDNRSASIVQRIALEERAHVAVGVYWFYAICTAQGVQPKEEFLNAVIEICPDLIKGPFNTSDRDLVGLDQEFYDERLWNRATIQRMEAAREARKHGILTQSVQLRQYTKMDIELLQKRLDCILDLESSFA